MIILPAIDLHEGKCVRLYKGDYGTAEVVAADAVETAKSFKSAGAEWMHMVDLDGAKDGVPKNSEIIFDVIKNVDIKVEVGGGIRNMETVEHYLENGVSRVILGSAAIKDPEFVREAVKKYGEKIAVGIDAVDGKAAADGWLNQSGTDYIELAKKMEAIGVSCIICTDIGKDGTMTGPNTEMLDKLNRAVSCDIIASGGVSCIEDIAALKELGLYGAIAGKAVYNGALDLREALDLAHFITANIDDCFQKSELIPAIVQDDDTNEVLMLAYMNKTSLRKTLDTGYTWFYSRSRKSLWNKGETSGNTQRVVSVFADCDSDTLLVRVKPNGPACHTGSRSCFFKKLK